MERGIGGALSRSHIQMFEKAEQDVNGEKREERDPDINLGYPMGVQSAAGD